MATPSPAENWETSELDFFVGLLQMFGRYVRVQYSRDGRYPDLIGARVEMRCWDREHRFSFTVEARMRPDGVITTHGGNWIESASTLREAIGLFASSASYAQSI